MNNLFLPRLGRAAKAFTLIDLLVVIAIIGILAGAVCQAKWEFSTLTARRTGANAYGADAVDAGRADGSGYDYGATGRVSLRKKTNRREEGNQWKTCRRPFGCGLFPSIALHLARPVPSGLAFLCGAKLSGGIVLL